MHTRQSPAACWIDQKLACMSPGPTENPNDPAYRPPLNPDLPWPPVGAVDHPNLKELLYFNLESSQVVADIGCGPGPFEYHRYHAKFIGFDAFPPQNEAGLKPGRDEIRVGRLEQFPLEDNSCDAVVMGFILEHVKNPEVFLREAFRVLRPHGWCYIAVPNYHSLEDRLFRLATSIAGSTRGPHIQQFTFESFTALSSGCGFELQAWHILNSSYLWMRHPKLQMFRGNFIMLLKLLRRLGIDLLREGNYQFLFRKAS
jgi:SAM-dependent methyltransferase